MEFIAFDDIDFYINCSRVRRVGDGIDFDDITRLDSIDGTSGRRKIILSGSGSFGSVDIIKELSGESDCFYSLAKYSLEHSCTVFCFVKTQSQNSMCENVVVTSHGALVDIISPTYLSCDPPCSGESIKIFKSGDVSIALLIGGDALEDSNWIKASDSSDIVICMGQSDEAKFRAFIGNKSAALGKPCIYVGTSIIDYHEDMRKLS